jgi:uncharacterized protein YneF (UPF0154 family)
VPTTAHVIYIPVILLLGIVLGFIWGAKVTKEAYMLAAKAAEERVRKRAERAAERAAAAEKSETPPQS